jgi:hypothetical protein
MYWVFDIEAFVSSVSLKSKIGWFLWSILKTKLGFRPKMPFYAFFHEQIISTMVYVSGNV